MRFSGGVCVCFIPAAGFWIPSRPLPNAGLYQASSFEDEMSQDGFRVGSGEKGTFL